MKEKDFKNYINDYKAYKKSKSNIIKILLSLEETVVPLIENTGATFRKIYSLHPWSFAEGKYFVYDAHDSCLRMEIEKPCPSFGNIRKVSIAINDVPTDAQKLARMIEYNIFLDILNNIICDPFYGFDPITAIANKETTLLGALWFIDERYKCEKC